MDAKPTLAEQVLHYLEWMRVHHFSPNTLRTRSSGLKYFVAWCEMQGLEEVSQVQLRHIEAFKLHLSQCPGRRAAVMAAVSVYDRLVEVQAFFRYMARERLIMDNPAADLELPRLEKPLPRYLTEAEVEKVLAQPDISTARGLRDRAFMETLYSTGVRRSEAVHLKMDDVHIADQVVMVRLGKGRKDRCIPIGKRALYWIERYLLEVRPKHAPTPDEGILFLTRNGSAIQPGDASPLVRHYMDMAGICKPGACHLFRHAMAKAMLERGADIRHIQEMLGHTRLQTTERYTHITLTKLREVLEHTHPAEIQL